MLNGAFVAGSVSSHLCTIGVWFSKEKERLVAYKSVRLPSPVNAPLSIDVIWFLARSLHKQYGRKNTP